MGSDHRRAVRRPAPPRRPGTPYSDRDEEMPAGLHERAVQDHPVQPGEVLRLQGALGNRAVAGLIGEREASPAQAVETTPTPSAALQNSSGTSASSFSLDVIIPCAGPTTTEPAAPKRALPATVAAADSAEKESSPVTVREEEGEVEEEEADAIAPTLVYKGTVGARPNPPSSSQFGVTSTQVKMTGVKVDHVTPGAALAPGVKTGRVGALITAFSGGGPPTVSSTSPPAANHFKVTAGVDVTANWCVHGLGRTDITNASSPAITGANYQQAAADLTPNMASDGGRPRRSQFWASDLTSIHERFHANERTGSYGRAAFELAKAWLGTQTATTEQQATALVDQVPSKMFESYNASFVPGKETRAYGDGAPLYRERANAILARADEFAFEGIGHMFGGGGD